MVQAGLGGSDEAFDSLEEAYAANDARLIWLKVDPGLDGLRSDSRFRGLLRRVGFTI